jgi:TIR domain
MADIFLSYNEQDRDAVRRLAERLQSSGWSVWWDRRIPAGLTWRGVLERELANMRCMVVLWSQYSVASEWVCEEAAEGRQLGRLVPVLLEHVLPPRGFREIQAADLVGWDGSPDFLGLRQLVEDIERLIGKPSAPVQAAFEASPHAEQPARAPPTPAQPFPWAMSALLAVSLLALIVAMAGAYYDTVSRRTPELRDDGLSSLVKPAAPTSRAMPFDGASAATSPAAARASGASVKTASNSQASASKPTLSVSSVNARCVAMRERLALGETLSGASQVFFQQECTK